MRILFVVVEAGIRQAFFDYVELPDWSNLEARPWMLDENRPSNAGFRLKPAVGGSSFYDKHRYEHRQP